MASYDRKLKAHDRIAILSAAGTWLGDIAVSSIGGERVHLKLTDFAPGTRFEYLPSGVRVRDEDSSSAT